MVSDCRGYGRDPRDTRQFWPASRDTMGSYEIRKRWAIPDMSNSFTRRNLAVSSSINSVVVWLFAIATNYLNYMNKIDLVVIDRAPVVLFHISIHEFLVIAISL